jgi:dipeptidase D
MNEELLQLQPVQVWHYLKEILEIPRPSKKEDKILEYLLDFGRKHKLETLRDEAGNILIRKPASKGMEKVKSIVLQSHVDMVCEKNADTEHDFDRDAIVAWKDGDWIKAKGTTLGADNGIGIAAQLAILADDTLTHGPVECLFTVDEETGLTGAKLLRPDFLKSRTLLNLDSEDEGELFIGCAGGKDTVAYLDFRKESVPAGSRAYSITVSGLQGGHSGDDINKGRGNANKIINRILWHAQHHYQTGLALFDGGNLRNAIAREAHAIIVVHERHEIEFLKAVDAITAAVADEYRKNEPGLKITCEMQALPEYIVDASTQFRLLNALYACPHGVMAFSADIPGFVETSTNLASVKFGGNRITVATSQRSSVESAKEDVANMVESVFALAVAAVEHSEGYPGWSPDSNSSILEITRTTYHQLFGEEPRVLVIHAGLECGLIGAKYPGMDMISFGPTIKGAHSPDERLHIPSVMKFWLLLLEVLKRV